MKDNWLKNLVYGFIILVCIVSIFETCNRKPSVIRTEFHTDTIVVRDTIRDTILIPQRVYIARYDTVYIKKSVETLHVCDTCKENNHIADISKIIVPIERKEYRTEDYFAVVEGFRPNLVTMELYPPVHYITNTETRTVRKKPKFGVGVQAGYGITPKGPQPYIGVGIQYNIWSF